MLALTLDNCNYWKIIPTPLDQKKYNKTNLESRPQINRTAIFNDYLLVKQEELVFYTKRDTIRWTPLPDYTDFYTDAANSALFFQLKAGGFVRADNAMQPLFKADIDADCFDVACKQANLFVMTSNEVIQLQADNTIRSSLIRSNRDADVTPEPIGYLIGSIGNNVYTQKEYGGQWEYLLTLPFKTDSGYLSATGDNRIIYYKGRDSVYYYSIATNGVKKRSVREMLSDFWKPGIKKIVYGKSSQGCFDSRRYEVVYNKSGDHFELAHSSKEKTTVTLQTDIAEIDATAVENFVRRLPGFYNEYAHIQDLGFTETDYAKCKKDILKFKERLENHGETKTENGFHLARNNIDFDRLISTVDTIRQLNDRALNRVLTNIDEVMSTTTNWVSLTIVNRDNKTMYIANSSAEANALYFPWRVTIDGATTIMYAMPITHFIRETCPLLLPETNRVKVLHTFVRRLYK